MRSARLSAAPSSAAGVVGADDGAEASRRHDAAERAQFARDLLAGLAVRPRRIPCKYFYDAEGSILFERICHLPEYYPTRTELALLARHAPEVAKCMGPEVELVEFGAGSGEKARLLLDALERPRAYVPIDIARAHLHAATDRLAGDYPGLPIRPVAADYTRPFALPAGPAGSRRAGFFPGSTIGNFAPAEAQRFLAMAARMLAGGGLLVGVDLLKEPALLHAAYNDAAGLTAAFNRNLLARANRELGADFAPAAFAHYAFYQPTAQRMEMHLVSLRRQEAHVLGRAIRFAAGDAIHTENSYKYTVGGFQALAAQAGFMPRACWTDAERLFSMHWLDARHRM